MTVINPQELQKIIQAISLIQKNIQWKPQKAEPHLQKRIRLGHLPENATLETYEIIIATIVANPDSQVYIYRYQQLIYPTITLSLNNTLWLVMIGLDGILETAFPPSNPQQYLSNPAFIYIGNLKELS
jgi:hypothetical protein